MHIKVQDLLSMVNDERHVQLVDVRSPGEFDSGHVPTAINIPMDQIDSRLPDLEKRATVVLLCQSGNRAGIVCDLVSSHHDKVLVLDGGTNAWMAAGLPTVKSTKTRWSLERQVRLAAGLLVLVGVMGSLTVAPAWLGLSAFVGAGLSFAGLTDLCPMALLLGKLPWNRPAKESLRSGMGVAK